jgi:hypothetical protein
VVQSNYGYKQIFVTEHLKVPLAVLSVTTLGSPSLPACMSVIIVFFLTKKERLSFLKALSHLSSRLAGRLSTWSSVATDEGIHETSISTIFEPLVGRITI